VNVGGSGGVHALGGVTCGSANGNIAWGTCAAGAGGVMGAMVG